MDADGRFTYSDVIKITGISGAGCLSVYPNPVRDKTTLTIYSNTSSGKKVWLTDVNGSTVKTLVMNGIAETVDLGNLSPGLYILHTEDGITQKIIKE